MFFHSFFFDENWNNRKNIVKQILTFLILLDFCSDVHGQETFFFSQMFLNWRVLEDFFLWFFANLLWQFEVFDFLHKSGEQKLLLNVRGAGLEPHSANFIVWKRHRHKKYYTKVDQKFKDSSLTHTLRSFAFSSSENPSKRTPQDIFNISDKPLI